MKTLLTLATCLFCFQSSSLVRLETSEELLKRLNDKIVSLLVTVEKPDYHPPTDWRRLKNLYPSWIHMYMHGNPMVTELRRRLQVYDNNAFATAWITVQLVEAAIYGGYEDIDPDQILAGIQGVDQFRDRNRPEAGSSVVTFWKQEFNATSDLWSQTNENMLGIIDYTRKSIPWNSIKWLMQKLGIKNLAQSLEKMLFLFDAFPHIVTLPADFDDSAVNLGLGLLLQNSGLFSEAAEFWNLRNNRSEILMDIFKLYAYRPFSQDNETNVIDPRTYFYARPWLVRAMNNKQPVALITTWAQNFTENTRQRPSVATPLNVNNVDCTVAANSLYAITAALLSNVGNVSRWFDSDMKMLYLNTTNFVTWAVMNGTIGEWPDLALTYYPSQYNFYWFLSRTLFLIRSSPNPLRDETAAVRDMILQARIAATKWLTDQATSIHDIFKGNLVYFDDFLGNGDTDILGKPVKHGEARIASTAMALNAFFGYWTTFKADTKKLQWDAETPSKLKTTISKAVTWLKRHLFSPFLQDMNLFFSASAKGNSSQPEFYPMNFIYYVNGSKPEDVKNLDYFSLILGWQGVVSEKSYKHWMKAWEKNTHYKPYTHFPGYNSKESVIWPYWSSPTFTYSSSLLALSLYDNIDN